VHTLPGKTEIKIESLAELAVDCWRFQRWIGSRGDDDSLTVPKHVVRRLTRFLEEAAVITIDLTGQPFDPGLATEVIDTVKDASLLHDVAVISETVSPIVMWENTAVKHAQVVVRHNPSVCAPNESEDVKS